MANDTLGNIGKKLAAMKMSPAVYLGEYDYDKVSVLNLRSMKKALFDLFVAQRYEIDNLVKFLDHDNDGFVTIDEFEKAMRVGARGVTVGRDQRRTGAEQKENPKLNEFLQDIFSSINSLFFKTK